MKRILGALLLLASPAAAEIRYGSFPSPSLGRDVAYLVDLPASYAAGKGPYPVIYALHGLFESHAFWERRGLAEVLRDLEARGEVLEVVVAAVDGGDSFFVDGPAGRYQEMVVRDFVDHVEAAYRVARGRQGRALLGVSMGGYAALRIAFQSPERYGAVATHSAMLLRKAPTVEEGAGRWHMDAFHRVFGNPIDTVRWAKADPLAWAERVDPRAAPALSFDCGAQDRYGLLAGHEELHRRLQSRGVAHEFSAYPGDHGYDYVRSVLPHSLRFLGSALSGASSKRAKRPGS